MKPRLPSQGEAYILEQGTKMLCRLLKLLMLLDTQGKQRQLDGR